MSRVVDTRYLPRGKRSTSIESSHESEEEANPSLKPKTGGDKVSSIVRSGETSSDDASNKAKKTSNDLLEQLLKVDLGDYRAFAEFLKVNGKDVDQQIQTRLLERAITLRRGNRVVESRACVQNCILLRFLSSNGLGLLKRLIAGDESTKRHLDEAMRKLDEKVVDRAQTLSRNISSTNEETKFASRTREGPTHPSRNESKLAFTHHDTQLDSNISPQMYQKSLQSPQQQSTPQKAYYEDHSPSSLVPSKPSIDFPGHRTSSFEQQNRSASLLDPTSRETSTPTSGGYGYVQGALSEVAGFPGAIFPIRSSSIQRFGPMGGADSISSIRYQESYSFGNPTAGTEKQNVQASAGYVLPSVGEFAPSFTDEFELSLGTRDQVRSNGLLEPITKTPSHFDPSNTLTVIKGMKVTFRGFSTTGVDAVIGQNVSGRVDNLISLELFLKISQGEVPTGGAKSIRYTALTGYKTNGKGPVKLALECAELFFEGVEFIVETGRKLGYHILLGNSLGKTDKVKSLAKCKSASIEHVNYCQNIEIEDISASALDRDLMDSSEPLARPRITDPRPFDPDPGSGKKPPPKKPPPPPKPPRTPPPAPKPKPGMKSGMSGRGRK